jgi:hypothetical protein
MPTIDPGLKPIAIDYIQGDMRKLFFVEKMYKTKPELLTMETMQHIFQTKSYNDDAKQVTKTLLTSSFDIDHHTTMINETDRTIIALLWHENIVDYLEKIPNNKSFPFYLRILENICYADYIDRITFQNQIWQFNEMSSLMKTFYNNKLYHEYFPNKKINDSEIRFTKVLTKYSTEYNNYLFIFSLCQTLDMDRKDLVAFFQEMRLFYGANEQNDKLNELEKVFENENVNKLDIKRMYRYLDRNVKNNVIDDLEYDDDEST